MEEINAVSKARQRTRKGTFNKSDFGFEQRHEEDREHYHTILFAGQYQLGFVNVEIEAKVGPRRTALGYFTLNPTQAKALANALNEFADAAQKDRDNPEYGIEELPDSVLS
jgi:hypothetical protein